MTCKFIFRHSRGNCSACEGKRKRKDDTESEGEDEEEDEIDKQKTAYEISVCDWSSDVCSSDLPVYFLPKVSHEVA